MSERESDEETLAHLVFTLSHCLESLLFVMNLLVLGHISLVGEIIEIARISFRVQLWYKGRTSLSQNIPFNFSKVVVSIYIFDVREASCARVDASKG